MRKNNNSKLIGPLMVVLGIVALVVGLTSILKSRNYEKVPAVITKIDVETITGGVDETDTRNYTVYVKYTVDGKEYNEKLGYHQNSFAEGKEIEILYNPENPAQITYSGMGFNIYLMIIGPIVALFGVVLFIRRK